jgi:hypothetical protein
MKMDRLTRDCRDTVKARLARDPDYVDAMLDQFEQAQAEIAHLKALLKRARPQGEEVW